jgi:hypothetical protein
MSRRFGITLVVVAATAAVVPPAEAAKPKLYTVSFSGDARNESSRVRADAVYAPEGCQGSLSETYRFNASSGFAPKPSAAPVASYGRLRFRARLTSPSVAATTETTGSFTVDPNFPPDDPSVCSATPGPKSWSCGFSGEATRASGAEFALLPNKGKYEIYYNRNTPLVSCDDEFPMGVSLMGVAEPALTKLRVSAVKKLRKGKSTSASGTTASPLLDPGATGGETLNYTLKVKRVR